MVNLGRAGGRDEWKGKRALPLPKLKPLHALIYRNLSITDGDLDGMIDLTWGHGRTHGRGNGDGERGRFGRQSHSYQSWMNDGVKKTFICLTSIKNRPAGKRHSVTPAKLHVGELLSPQGSLHQRHPAPRSWWSPRTRSWHLASKPKSQTPGPNPTLKAQVLLWCKISASKPKFQLHSTIPASDPNSITHPTLSA